MSDHILDQLYAVLEERKSADPESSYVAKLYKKGVPKIAQKVGEEAVETVIAALQFEAAKDDTNLREDYLGESADLLFHLMTLWAAQGIKPEEVFGILKSRFGTSGLDRK